jgi:hypothetical protein
MLEEPMFKPGSIVLSCILAVSMLAAAQVAAPANASAVRILAGPIPLSVTDTSAQVSWISDNGSAATIMKYGIDANNMNQTAAAQSGNTPQQGNYSEHIVQLSGLQPDTVYHYGIYTQGGKFIDGSQFKTQPTNYRQTQVLRITKGPVIESLSSNSATIAWSTSGPGTAVVHYGNDPSRLDQSATGTSGAGTRRVKLANLQPNAVYYFYVESVSSTGGEPARSNEGRLQTLTQGETALHNPEPK